MAKLILTVEGQSLSVGCDIPKIVENSIDYLKYSVKTPSDWVGYTTQVLFTHGNETIIGVGNKVPKEVIKAPGFVVTVLGKITENGVIKSQIPSSPVPVKVYPSGELKANNPSQEDFTEDWYDEVVKTIQDFINNVDQNYDYESENPQSGKAVAQAIREFSEVVGEQPDNRNLWTLGDVEIDTASGYVEREINLPVGTYDISVCINTTVDSEKKSAIRFYSATGSLSYYFSRGSENIETKRITLSEGINKIGFYSGYDISESKNHTAIYSNITIIDVNATVPILTAKDDVAREGVFKISYDMKYLQNPNLYNSTGNWETGAYNFTSGKQNNNEAAKQTHVRNITPIELSSDKEYNIRTKARAGNLYVFTYDENMNYLGYKSAPANETIPLYHITDVSYVNFVVDGWASRYPDEPPQVMIWECADATDYGIWLEYGDKGKYVKEKQTFTNEQIADIQNKMNIQKFNRARFDDRFNFIAYSVIKNNDKGPINTAEHLEYCGSMDCFTALKGDVQPTSNGGVIMCHDKGFTLDENGRITTFNADNCVLIHDMTTEQCQALEHRTPYNGEYCKVITFEKYIQICKRTGKIAFITVRDQYIPEVIAHIMPILEKYRMIDRSIINSFTLSTLQAFREANESIMLSNVLNFGKVLTKAHINNAVSLGNCLINCFHFPSDKGWDLLDQSKEAIDYAIENDIRIYEGQTDSIDDIDLLVKYGIMGTQMIISFDTNDSKMSDTSTRAVQNKVVKAYIDSEVKKVAETIDETVTDFASKEKIYLLGTITEKKKSL